MANRRKTELMAHLEGAAPAREPVTGWRDTFPRAPTSSSARYQRKTYLLEPGMVDEIAILAAREGVPLNELVRFLLRHALDEVAAGRLDLPIEVVTVQTRRLAP